jgi:hypothetical protein
MIISDLEKSITFINILKEGYDVSSTERTNLITIYVNNEDWRYFRNFVSKKEEADYIDIIIHAVNKIGKDKVNEVISLL